MTVELTDFMPLQSKITTRQLQLEETTEESFYQNLPEPTRQELRKVNSFGWVINHVVDLFNLVIIHLFDIVR